MEEWRTIAGFENYLVSDQGRVCRLLTPCCSAKDSRLRVNLVEGDKRKGCLVHRLVAQAFIPNPLNLPEVNHLGDVQDCRAIKLEWRTGKGNMLYGLKNGQFGGNNPGIRFDSRRGHWTSEFYNEKKRVYLGCFYTKNAAIEARRKAIASLPEVL